MPLWIGGSGEKRTLRIVAEHATGWNTFHGDPAEYRHKLDVLERHCEAVGRDPGGPQADRRPRAADLRGGGAAARRGDAPAQGDGRRGLPHLGPPTGRPAHDRAVRARGRPGGDGKALGGELDDVAGARPVAGGDRARGGAAVARPAPGGAAVRARGGPQRGDLVAARAAVPGARRGEPHRLRAVPGRDRQGAQAGVHRLLGRGERAPLGARLRRRHRGQGQPAAARAGVRGAAAGGRAVPPQPGGRRRPGRHRRLPARVRRVRSRAVPVVADRATRCSIASSGCACCACCSRAPRSI